MEEINLYDLLRYYVKKWLVIVSAAIAGIIIGIIFTFYVQQPEYKSSATILLVGSDRTSATSESVVLNNYVSLFTSHRVLDPVIDKQDYKPGYTTLVANTTAENIKNTDIISVSMSTSEPKVSKALLENAMEEFGDQAKELYGNSSVKINIVDAASLSTSPANVKPLQQIGITTVAAIALVIIVLFFMYDYRHSTIAAQVAAKPVKKTAAAKTTRPAAKVTKATKTDTKEVVKKETAKNTTKPRTRTATQSSMSGKASKSKATRTKKN